MADAGICFVVGKPGAGKSFYATRSIVMALLRGNPVATNVPLRDGWWNVVAGMRFGHVRALWHGKGWLQARAERYRRLVFYFEDPNVIREIGVPGCGRCEHCRHKLTCTREGRAELVVDEAPKFLDPRLWNFTESLEEGAKPIVLRKRIVDGFRMHRKRGWSCKLLTQATGLIDNQLRGLGEQYILLRNLRRIPHWGNPFWYLRIDLFCATTYWGVPGQKGTLRAKTEWFFLNRRIAGLYDTMGGFSSDGSEDPTVWPWGGGPAGPVAEAPEYLQGGDADGTAGPDALAQDDEHERTEREVMA